MPFCHWVSLRGKDHLNLRVDGVFLSVWQRGIGYGEYIGALFNYYAVIVLT